MRNLSFSTKELYHVYNRGVDKRAIFNTKGDMERFLQSMRVLNNEKIVGSVRDASSRHLVSGKKGGTKLVKIIAFCLNKNHFHFILEPLTEKGIEKFMHKMGMSYAKYFNAKYRRSGSLFQGTFKAKLVDSNEYLLYLSSYINLNNKAHSRKNSSFYKSSWMEYVGEEVGLCDTEVIISQFKNRNEFRKFAEETLETIVERKDLLSELELEPPRHLVSGRGNL
ncbi:MAG: transposase [Parcubacteria group bacterium]